MLGSIIKWFFISIVVAFISYIGYKLGVKYDVGSKVEKVAAVGYVKVKKVVAAGYAKFKTFIN